MKVKGPLLGVPSQGVRHKLNRLHPRQGSLPKQNELQVINVDEESATDAQKLIAPPNTTFLKVTEPPKTFQKKNLKKLFDGEKGNVVNCLKRVFPKFGADRSHVQRVSVRSKFRKIFEIVS